MDLDTSMGGNQSRFPETRRSAVVDFNSGDASLRECAAEALISQGELVGDEIAGVLDSVGMREPTASDPYPEDLPSVPDERPQIKTVSESA